MRDKSKLTGHQEKFAVAFMKHGTQSAAYRDAYDCSKMKESTINRNAHAVFHHPKVKARIEQLQQQTASSITTVVEKAAAKREEDAQDVLTEVFYGALQVFQHWQDIALADPNKIVRHRRLNCRHCNGRDHHYQWADKAEFTKALAEAMDVNAARHNMKPRRKPLELPSDAGGYGWAFNAAPHPECPKCRGEGVPDVFITDTGLLGPRERKLYKGVRIKNGSIEVLMHDQADALTNIAKTLGILTEKIKLVDPNAPADMPALPMDPVLASRMYAEWVKGEGKLTDR